MVRISKWCIAIYLTAKLIATSDDDALLEDNEHTKSVSQYAIIAKEITELPESITPNTNYHIFGGVFKVIFTEQSYTHGVTVTINEIPIIGTIHSVPETKSRCFCQHNFLRVNFCFQKQSSSHTNTFPILTQCVKITDDQTIIRAASNNYVMPNSETECQAIIQTQRDSISKIAKLWLEQFNL